jgi:hypothetical protein
MYVVALAELGATVEAETPALAVDLGVTPYEVRLLLTAGLPAIVLATPELARATSLFEVLRNRKHGVVVCDSAATVTHASMVSMQRFRLDADAVVADDPGAAETRLDYEDIHALLRATHRQSVVATGTVRERHFRAGAAIMTMGVVNSKTTVREVKTEREEREEVLYAFRRSGATPWILRESAQFLGLGQDLGPTRHGNFLTTIRLLRERSRFARYDERLLSRRKLPELFPGNDGVDLLANVLSLWFAGAKDPYRK